jgi:hypothetical protein
MDIFTYVEHHVGQRATVEVSPGLVVSGVLQIEGDAASGSRIRDERDGTVYVLDSRSHVVD